MTPASSRAAAAPTTIHPDRVNIKVKTGAPSPGIPPPMPSILVSGDPNRKSKGVGQLATSRGPTCFNNQSGGPGAPQHHPHQQQHAATIRNGGINRMSLVNELIMKEKLNTAGNGDEDGDEDGDGESNGGLGSPGTAGSDGCNSDQPSSEPSSTSGGGGGRDEDSGGRETRRGVREDSGNDSGHNSMMTNSSSDNQSDNSCNEETSGGNDKKVSPPPTSSPRDGAKIVGQQTPKTPVRMMGTALPTSSVAKRSLA